jgi:diaminohydroxyphosphoribosylaminopyrimidine deaminase / 5-amino-6-(5-phosphoribosylamino)uracil reductase
MRRAIALARQAIGKVSPNPLVGAVIVSANQDVLAEGFHRQHGAVHAEIDALNQYEARYGSRNVPPGTTLYCNLEPCSHHDSKKINPPCTPQVIAAGFQRVVIGMEDPNPKVQGRGIAQIKAAGIEVITDICAYESRHLNRIFSTHIIKGRPHILLKMAQTLDGRIATVNGDSQWVTNAAARARGHQLRATYDAVMVGSNTAVHDNPRLNVRLVTGRNPLRVVIDSQLATPASHHLFQDAEAEKTQIYTSAEALAERGACYAKSKAQLIATACTPQGKIDLHKVVEQLYAQGVTSILVEGGAGLITALLQEKLADSVHIAIAPKILGHGTAAIGDLHHVTMQEALQLYDVSYEEIEQQILCEGHFQSCLPD